LSKVSFFILVKLPGLASELWSTSRFNLLEVYAGQHGNRTVALQLYRRGILIIRQLYARAPGKYGVRMISTVGRWEREGKRLILRIGSNSAVFEQVEGADPKVWRQSTGFPGFEKSPESSLAGIDFKREYKRQV
jgi:hypothetical protein